jgi:membrane associated rhomboid family serine protease
VTPELILILAAATVALTLISLFTRGAWRGELPQVALYGGCLAALGWVHATGRYESMVAFVAEGLAAVLVFLPRLLEGMEARALVTSRFGRALALARFHEIVIPGRAAHRRKRQLEDLVDTQAGRAQAAIDRLKAEIARATDERVAAALHEELIAVLLIDRRAQEGVDYFERHFGLASVGEHPQVGRYLLGAYAELQRLDRAAEVLRQLEASAAASHDTARPGLLYEARLRFLAHAGRVAQLETLRDGEGGARLHPAAWQMLLELARAHAGAELTPDVAALADATFERMNRPLKRMRRRAPVTLALVAVNALTFLAVVVGFGWHLDDASLIRAGALFRPALAGGEWWRVPTAMFLHASELHLALNMYGLWLLGRFAEDVFGSVRFFLVYLVGGLSGAAGSALFGSGAPSVGASGAIMGILGALIVTLLLRRGVWPEAWRRTLLVNLVMLGALQIYIGIEVAVIDNAAHVGGMIGGAAAAVLLAPGGLVPSGKRIDLLLRGFAVVLMAMLIVAAVQVARTPLARTFARVPMRDVELVGGVPMQVPRYWELDADHGKAEDPYFGIKMSVSVESGPEFSNPPDPRTEFLRERIRRSVAR